MLRDHLNGEELEAMRLLDAVRAGLPIPESAITWALWVTGDLVGCAA